MKICNGIFNKSLISYVKESMQTVNPNNVNI